MEIILNYSPNFDAIKRKPNDIKFIIFHYTGMKKEVNAIQRLTNPRSKVSSHYFINKNGKILCLVPELYIAWHAGISSWKSYQSINKYSIGIEVSNSGHENKYENFSKKQINSIVSLSKRLIKKYKIKSKFILGHSDISPDRKKDPGEKFPWYYLSKRKISFFHDLNKVQLKKIRNQKITKVEKDKFIQNLYKIGYKKYYNNKNSKYMRTLTKAFQRRFRQEMINGNIDRECLLISNNLVKKF